MDFVSILPVVVVTVSGLGLVVIGAALTEIGPWYRALRKPSWQPPNFLFGPVWTVIFFLMGVSALMAWRGAETAEARGAVFAAFAVNAVLNAAWSGIFFKLKRPDWAFAELVLLWLSIVWIMVVVAPVSAFAAWAVAPYLAWVSFAGLLNLTIVRLNPRSRRSEA